MHDSSYFDQYYALLYDLPFISSLTLEAEKSVINTLDASIVSLIQSCYAEQSTLLKSGSTPVSLSWQYYNYSPYWHCASIYTVERLVIIVHSENVSAASHTEARGERFVTQMA